MMNPIGAFGQTFELQAVIASGSSASVYRCTEKSAGRQLACKMSRREDSRWPWNHVIDLYEREAKLLRLVQGHPNVIQYAGLYKEPNRIYMVMELVKGGDLHTILTKQRCLPEDVARAAFTQLVSAIDHLHSNGVLHRDIKLENVLYDQTVSPAVIKVCDLGNSMLMTQPPSGNFKGTNGYTAPEVVNGTTGSWSAKADVWALGVVLYAMLGGYLPFDDSRGRHSTAQYLDFSNGAWWDISIEAKLLIQAMLTHTVAERATLDDVIDSAWLARVDPSRLPQPVAPPPLHPVASMPIIADVITRLSLRSYRKPSANNLTGSSNTSISENEVSCAAIGSSSPRPSGAESAAGSASGSSCMGGFLGGMGMNRGRGSISCNNIAGLAAMAGTQIGPSGLSTVSTGKGLGPSGLSSAASSAKAADGDGASQPSGSVTSRPAGAEDERLSDILTRCRQQGLRMSISVARGISSKPMQQQN